MGWVLFCFTCFFCLANEREVFRHFWKVLDKFCWAVYLVQWRGICTAAEKAEQRERWLWTPCFACIWVASLAAANESKVGISAGGLNALETAVDTGDNSNRALKLSVSFFSNYPISDPCFPAWPTVRTILHCRGAMPRAPFPWRTAFGRKEAQGGVRDTGTCPFTKLLGKNATVGKEMKKKLN